MTALFWILIVAIGVLIATVIILLLTKRDTRKSINRLNGLLENAERLIDIERADREYYQRAYNEARRALDTQTSIEEDMEYVRDSLLRAADDDPMT